MLFPASLLFHDGKNVAISSLGECAAVEDTCSFYSKVYAIHVCDFESGHKF
jgi:hypothetical protein